MTATVLHFPSKDHAMARGRFARNAVAQMGGDAMEQALAQIRGTFDAQLRADMMRERAERNRKMEARA